MLDLDSVESEDSFFGRFIEGCIGILVFFFCCVLEIVVNYVIVRNRGRY